MNWKEIKEDHKYNVSIDKKLQIVKVVKKMGSGICRIVRCIDNNNNIVNIGESKFFEEIK